MSREQAETYLRLLAEAQLRTSGPQTEAPARLDLVTHALTTTGAVGVWTADQIRQESLLADAARRPGPPVHLAHQPLPRDDAWVVRGPGGLHVVPVGQVTRFGDELMRGDLYVLAVAWTGLATHLMIAWDNTSWSHPTQLAARDDQGTTYKLTYRNLVPPVPASGAGLLELDPSPPPGARWLDLTLFPGMPAIRVGLRKPPGPLPEVSVTPAALSPGAFLLEAIAARLLAQAPRGSPYAIGLGDIVAALRAVGQLPEDSPLPGQLRQLCQRLGAAGHGLVAKPARLPDRWRSVLDGLGRPPDPGPSEAAAGADLGEIDGARIVLLGLHHGEHGTAVFLDATDVIPEDDWEYLRAVRPLPVLWLRDRSGSWHTTGRAAILGGMASGVVTLRLDVVPPLPSGLAGAELVATGQATEVRVRLPQPV